MSVAAVAEQLGTSPQNLNAKFNRKSIKTDFLQKIKEIIDRCAPPLPAEMEAAVIGSNVRCFCPEICKHRDDVLLSFVLLLLQRCSKIIIKIFSHFLLYFKLFCLSLPKSF